MELPHDWFQLLFLDYHSSWQDFSYDHTLITFIRQEEDFSYDHTLITFIRQEDFSYDHISITFIRQEGYQSVMAMQNLPTTHYDSPGYFKCEILLSPLLLSGHPVSVMYWKLSAKLNGLSWAVSVLMWARRTALYSNSLEGPDRGQMEARWRPDGEARRGGQTGRPNREW